MRIEANGLYAESLRIKAGDGGRHQQGLVHGFGRAHQPVGHFARQGKTGFVVTLGLEFGLPLLHTYV